MKWTVISDNRTQNPSLQTEHGLSILLETDKHRHLLDDHESEEELTALAQKLKASYPDTQFYTSHCTGDKVFAILKDIMGDHLQLFFSLLSRNF